MALIANKIYTINGFGTSCCSCYKLFKVRQYASAASRMGKLPSVMSAWQIFEYGDLSNVSLSSSLRLPVIQRPKDVLVEVHAASINPIDVRMIGGYGSKALNTFRWINGQLRYGSEFPLVLGRDFSGKIVALGGSVNRSKYKVGDEVWGAGNVAFSGSFANYLTISSDEISLKPKSLSHVEAASLPYVAATTWSALCCVGQHDEKKTKGKRALVIGASGGLGTFAIQLLKSWGADVTAVCSNDAVGKMLELGADAALEYNVDNFWNELAQSEKYDIILDAVGRDTTDKCIRVMRPGAMYVTVVTPFLHNTDVHGVLLGGARTLVDAAMLSGKALSSRVDQRWALFMPSGKAMRTVAKLVDDGKIAPVVEKVYPFSQLPDALAKVAAGHNRGKTVINMKTEEKS